MDIRNDADEADEQLGDNLDREQMNGEWRDARSSAEQESDRQEWRRGIQPLRSDEWGSPGRSGADAAVGLGPEAAVKGSADGGAFAGSDGRSSDTAGNELSHEDRAALLDITGSGHVVLNRALSEGTIEDVEEVAARIGAVSRALEKIPSHEGLVLRGSGGNLTEEQIGGYDPGDIRIEDRFLHSSVDPEVADGIFGGNVVWAIESKSGRGVEQYSAVSPEKEIMFDKFSRFEVLAKDRVDGTGQWLIYMREL